LSTKVKLPSKADVKFTVSEDIRQEGLGRFSLLGVFAGERFAVGGDLPQGFGSAAFVLPSLAFLFVISKGEGTVPGSIKITAPDGKTVVGQSSGDFVMQADKATVIANIAKPFIGPAFGTYTVQIGIGPRRYKFPVVIEEPPRATRRKAKSEVLTR